MKEGSNVFKKSLFCLFVKAEGRGDVCTKKRKRKKESFFLPNMELYLGDVNIL